MSSEGKDTEAIWRRQRSRTLDTTTQRLAWRKLAMLDAAETLGDLRVPPGNRLEKLAGDRVGQYSIRINEIVHGQRRISADTALRLARYFGTSERFWINLQARYDNTTDEPGEQDRSASLWSG